MQPEIVEFLQTDRNAILATNGPNGAPQLTPVWFIFEEGVLYVSAQVSTVKIRNLRRDPTVTVCIDGGRGDARYVVLYGKGELIEPEAPRQEPLRWQIVRHYYADESDARRYYETVKDSPAAVIALRPQRVVAQGFPQAA